MLFVNETDATSPDGIEENYLGNEEDEEAAVMKFQKSNREMLTTLHSHILSMSFIFFFLGALVAITSLPKKIKSFLMIEPFFSIILTFGGIYFLWQGMLWMKYIVIISGIVMTGVFLTASISILLQLLKKEK